MIPFVIILLASVTLTQLMSYCPRLLVFSGSCLGHNRKRYLHKFPMSSKAHISDFCLKLNKSVNL